MIEYSFFDVTYSAVLTALLTSVRYWLFRDSLRVPFWLIYVLLVPASLGSGWLGLCLCGAVGITYQVWWSLTAFIMYAVSCILIKEPFVKHTFAWTMLTAYGSAMHVTLLYLRKAWAAYSTIPAYIIMALIIAATFVPAARYLKRVMRQLIELENDSIWVWLCVNSLAIQLTNFVLSFQIPAELPLKFLVSRYLVMLGSIGMLAAAERAVKTMRESTEARASLELTTRRIAMQQSCYDRLITQMDEVRRMRHDLRHHRAAIAALIQSGDTSSLSEYLHSTASVDEMLPVTGNFAADSVLTYYIDAAKALGARMETDLVIGRKTPVSDSDLCVILGNLLENAVDAQEYVEAERRCIRVTARADESSLTLAVDNRFDGTLNVKNGAYITRKEGGGHGIGISSVRAVCEKYGGVFQIETECDMFMAGVFIAVN